MKTFECAGVSRNQIESWGFGCVSSDSSASVARTSVLDSTLGCDFVIHRNSWLVVGANAYGVAEGTTNAMFRTQLHVFYQRTILHDSSGDSAPVRGV